MNPFESLIADFAKMTGLPLSPDARNGCALETDGLFITIQYRTEADDIVIFAPVTDPEAAERPTKAMLEKALSLAYDGKGTSGASLGLFDGELILSVHIPMQGLDAETLGVKLAAFADAAVSARAEIAAAVDVTDGVEGGGEGGRSDGGAADGPNGDVSGFMRV